MNVLYTTLQNALEQIQGVHPLLHCISNIVTANDCANLALAIGASPRKCLRLPLLRRQSS